jgi:hypothetical protein
MGSSAKGGSSAWITEGPVLTKAYIKTKAMRTIFISITIMLIIMSGAFTKMGGNTYRSGYKKNIKFNHLFVVIDDSTYKYLFDSLTFLKTFAKVKEDTVGAGDASWTGKYITGRNNYLEIFRPGGAKGTVLGDFGLGFMTNKFGTIDSLQNDWAKALDSVHVEHMVIGDSGKTSPWYTSISIPNVDSLRISAWVMENSKEEMNYAGFTDTDLSREIDYSEYARNITAKVHHIPVDSVQYDKLFDKVTSLDIRLSTKELAYLSRLLTDIGFTEKKQSFSKDGFVITYSIHETKHFSLKEIKFSLLKKMPKDQYSFKKIKMLVDGDKAAMQFNYD